MKITKSTAEVYSLRSPDSWDWARISIQSWKEGGSIQITSSYGNYNFIWSDIGEDTFKKFLSKLYFDYFMNKATGSKYTEFDGDESLKAAINTVLLSRRMGNITKEEALDYYDRLLCLRDDGLNNSRDLYISACLDMHVFNDYDCVPQISRTKSECQGFWDMFWKPLLEQFEKENYE